MEVGKTTQLNASGESYYKGPLAANVTENRIKELEGQVERLEVLTQELERNIKDLQDSFKSLSYDLWEAVNGYDI